jgi:CAAX prenyl protease-like protein
MIGWQPREAAYLFFMKAKTAKWSLFIPYLLPYLAFLGTISLARNFPKGVYPGYMMAYTAAALLLWIFWRRYGEIQGNRITPWDILSALLVGLAGIAIWILPYHYFPGFIKLDAILGFSGGGEKVIEPLSLPKVWYYPFFMIRFIGYIFIVPIFEELFIRSFLWRYLINPDIKSVAVGTYSALAFWGTALLFSLSRHQWLVAFLYALIINLYLVFKKDLRLCMIAHGLSNAILIVYVLISGKWFLW